MADKPSRGKTRAGTEAQPFPWEEALEAQLGRTKKRFKGLAEDPINELRNITRQYLYDPTATPEENEQKIDDFTMNMVGSTGSVKGALKKASEVFGKHEGKYLMITEADRTKIGGGFLGGPGFSGLQHELPAYKEARAAWGVAAPGKAVTIANANARVPEGQAIWAPMLGSPTQHKSNQMVFDQILNKFRRSARAGQLEPDLHKTINYALANIFDKKTGNPLFPPDVDIMAKNFRSLANTFDRRAAAADIMGGVGVGGKKGTIIDYPEIIRSTTDPLVMDSPVGSIGPRAFTLTGEIGEHPELNPAFPYILRGEDLGELYTPVPRDLAMLDVVGERAAAGKKPTVWAFTRGHGPMQFMSEDWLTNLQKHGYAQGGLAMAGGGQFPPQAEIDTEIERKRPRTRAGVPVKDTNVLGGAIQGLGEMLLGAGRGAMATGLGAPADILNMIDLPKLMTGESYQIPYGSEYFLENLPLEPTTHTGKTAQTLGQFLPINPEQPVKAAVKGVKKAGKALAPTLEEMFEAQMKPYQMAIAPEGKAGKVKAPANEIGFYNPAEKAALNLQRKKGAGDAFIADLKKQPGVNDERIAELGLDQLKGKPAVTKEEIIALAEQNRIPLRESVKSERNENLIEDLESRFDEIQEEIYEARSRGDSYALSRLDNEMQDNLSQQKALKSVEGAKFSPAEYPNYNTPGGKNYREIRVGLPSNRPSIKNMSREEYNAAIDKADREGVTDFFHEQHHGDEPNVLFHLRVADHTDVDGKKGLYVSELQSDLHQQGREKGYKGKVEKEYNDYFDGLKNRFIAEQTKQNIKAGMTPTDAEYYAKEMHSGIVQREGDRAIARAMGEEDKILDISNRYKQELNAVPDAPFKDNWYQIGLKRAIKEAVDNGMDRVYLSKGKTQIDRYENALRANVDAIEYEPYKGDNGELLFEISGVKNGEPIIEKEGLTYKELQELVGKDMAEKMKNNVGESLAEERPMRPAWMRLSGDNLSIGGEGMKQWYDKNYKNFADSYVKQFGSKVDDTKLKTGKGDGEEVYYFEVTPEMRESAKKGQRYAEGGAVHPAVDKFASSLPHPAVAQFEKKMADGGGAWSSLINGAYNTTPDVADAERTIQGPAYAEGGGVWKQLVKGAANA